RWKRFLAGLYEAGWTVEVLTAPPEPRYVDQTQDPEPYLTIHSTPQVSSLPDSRVGRLAKAVVHAAAAVPLSLTTEGDVVFATVPALPNMLAGIVIAWPKGVAYVACMRDAWPDLIAESETR